MAFQFRRGTDAERQSITPKPGEPLYVTDTGQVYVGDGTTQGGNLVSISVSDDDSPSLGGNLDLNGNDIIGTGNINIDGFITATGNINLGDGAEDNIIVGGVIDSSLIPAEDGLYDLGDETSAWREGYFEGLNVDGEISVGSINVDTIFKEDSAVLYDSNLDTLSVDTIESNIITGTLAGSVVGDDSTLLVDSSNNSLNSSFIKIIEERFENQIDEPLRFLSDRGLRSIGTPTQSLLEANAFVLNTVPENLSSLASEDIVGAVGYAGWNGSDFQVTNVILSTVANNGGSGTLPSDFSILSADENGDLFTSLSINQKGTVSANVFQTGSYINEQTRDADISDPQPGMIILLTGHDDSTGTPKFQGYNGIQWVDLT